MNREKDFSGEGSPARVRVRIAGSVQGVGFRPFVFALAEELGISGWVLNDDEGVLLEAEGDRLDEFCRRVRSDAPPLSDPRELVLSNVPSRGEQGFRIRESSGGSSRFTLIPPDTATCDDCLGEVFDAADRRYRYPFTNCTRCGPRYSIVEGLPYDRENTSMRVFAMCGACGAEYRDPKNRRFHAQPNACPACGPELGTDDGLRGEAALERTLQRLRAGEIVAVRGVGGFHLACDATSDRAVRELRRRKRRSNKPFAVMARDMNAVREVAIPTPEEARLLASPASPIVLLSRREDGPLSVAVSPGCPDVGVMLPYTPLHHLLFRTGSPGFRWLVMTSGNRAEEPIAASDAEAEARLADLADARLSHNREIVMRSDDSVVRHAGGRRRFLRRARGFVPEGLPFPFPVPRILGCGAMLKGTFTLTRDGTAVVSQHIGDLEGEAALDFYGEALRHLSTLYRISPDAVAHDIHPDYPSTRFALDYAEGQGISQERVMGVQHHHAHVASVMAEHGLVEPVIGVALDGTGYGPDGTVWGGEFLVVSPAGCRRAGHFRTFPLPGGEAAIREPWRAAAGAAAAVLGGDAAADLLERRGWLDRFGGNTAEAVLRLATSGQGSVATSSAGRVFDAVAALLELRHVNTFEGEAAMALEAAAGFRHGTRVRPYPFGVLGTPGELRVLDWFPVLRGILDDRERARPVPDIAAGFHETMCEAVRAMVREIRRDTGIDAVALSGGVFQNRLILEGLERLLREDGMAVYSNERVPSNDGGVSLGQAYVAAGRMER